MHGWPKTIGCQVCCVCLQKCWGCVSDYWAWLMPCLVVASFSAWYGYTVMPDLIDVLFLTSLPDQFQRVQRNYNKNERKTAKKLHEHSIFKGKLFIFKTLFCFLECGWLFNDQCTWGFEKQKSIESSLVYPRYSEGQIQQPYLALSPQQT